MIRIKETIVVEGKYDKNKLSSLVDGVIIETNGFGIFKDKKRLAMIRRLAEKNGLVILTDSAGAGFLGRAERRSTLTKVDFYELGLSGRENSAGKRTALLKRLELPEHLSPNGLLQALSVLYTREELFQLCEELEDDKES